MAYIFLDESGDLGFDFTKSKTSKYFVITFLFVVHKRSIEKIIKHILQGFSQKERTSHHGILHCYKEKPSTRLRLLTQLSKKDVNIMTIFLNKERVYTKLQDEKQVLYNYVTNILLDRVLNKRLIPLDEKITIVASRRETNRFFNENFKTYLTSQAAIRHKINIAVEVRTPKEEKSLQIVDFVCWAAFRKREHRDESYWNVIKAKCIEESSLFP